MRAGPTSSLGGVGAPPRSSATTTAPTPLPAAAPLSHLAAGPTGEEALHFARLRSSPGVVFVVRDADVERMPARPTDATTRRALFICERFARGDACPPRHSTPATKEAPQPCRDVHVDFAFARKLRPHFRNPGANISTPRLGPAGALVYVRVSPSTPRPRPRSAPGNQTEEGEANVLVRVLDAGDCLYTRAPYATHPVTGPTVALCPHFMAKSVCDFGAWCERLHPLGQPQQPPAHDAGFQQLAAGHGLHRPTSTEEERIPDSYLAPVQHPHHQHPPQHTWQPQLHGAPAPITDRRSRLNRFDHHHRHRQHTSHGHKSAAWDEALTTTSAEDWSGTTQR